MEIFLIPETMIRYGKQEDLVQIDAFDKFGGEREQEIAARGLQVYYRYQRKLFMWLSSNNFPLRTSSISPSRNSISFTVRNRTKI